LYKKVLTI